MARRMYRVLPGWASVLFLSPIVFMFVWSWKVGLAWLGLFVVCMREVPSD